MQNTKSNCELLHLGCGLNTPADWLNVDGSWNAWLAVKAPFVRRTLRALRLAPERLLGTDRSGVDVVHDLRNPLPWHDGSFRAIYASHVLEHLHRSEAETLLQECFRVLKPGGVARFMVPDLHRMAERYLAREERGSLPADAFVRDLSFRDDAPMRGSLPYRLYSALTDFHSHKWMYDEESLVFYVKRAGFAGVERREIGQSAIKNIGAIEKNTGLCVEGVRP